MREPAGISVTILSAIRGESRVSGFYTDDDKMRHAIVADNGGQVIEIFYGQKGKGQGRAGAFNNIVDIAGFLYTLVLYIH